MNADNQAVAVLETDEGAAGEKQYDVMTCDVRAADDADDRTFDFMGTTAARDRMGDELTLSGWDVTPYRENPVVLWGHNYGKESGPEVVIGKTLSIKRQKILVKNTEREGLVFRVRFVEPDIHPYGEMVRKLVKGGYLRAVSVGFRSLKSSWIEESDEEKEERKKKTPDSIPWKSYEKKELLELSIVPVPANAEALLVARNKGLEMPEELNAALEAYIDDRKAALATTREIRAKLDELDQRHEKKAEPATVRIDVSALDRDELVRAIEEHREEIIEKLGLAPDVARRTETKAETPAEEEGPNTSEAGALSDRDAEAETASEPDARSIPKRVYVLTRKKQRTFTFRKGTKKNV